MYNYLLKHLEHLQSKGRYAFTLQELKEKFRKKDSSISMALLRLSKKEKIITVKKGFYVIIPPEYSGNKMLSPYLFINDMMEYSGKKYYLGLLTAAVFHGASHHQPQEIYVITTQPSMRAVTVNKLKINFVCRKKINVDGLEERKTDTGYIKISGPTLTALDLIQLNKNVGGLNRVVEVIGELVNKIDSRQFKKLAMDGIPISVFQRLGYILEHMLKKRKIADSLWAVFGKRLKRHIALNPVKQITGYKSNNRWKIIENDILEIEE